ncbi:hypothetical protein [uncultured Mucilaginibacter sp.]|uniref:hypothetical protein n=1 Tax=uncultured Mucilaginibacter sp. TaxID=797541 RepID=UPI0025DBDE6F|nr:hypothetical protein [uncultured Mucilaginibacter sp.]
MKYFALLVTVFVLMTQHSTAQTYSLDDFEEVSIPAPYGKQLNEWNNIVDQYFKVSITNGYLKISKETYNKTSVRIKVAGGSLIGEDHGEFGGGLYYDPIDTNVKHMTVNGKLALPKEGIYYQGIAFINNGKAAKIRLIPIKPGNIKDVFEYKGTLYTVEGLAHMSSSYGSFNDIEVKKNEVNYKEVLKLDDAPMAYVIHEEAIYLATLERFYIIRDWKAQLIADRLFWRYLYPNSVAVKDSKHIYLGMRAGYAMVDTESGKVIFYKFKKQK